LSAIADTDRMDVSTEELFDVVDAAVRELLARAGVVEPPVDALWIAQRILNEHRVFRAG